MRNQFLETFEPSQRMLIFHSSDDSILSGYVDGIEEIEKRARKGCFVIKGGGTW